jgi:hypothetical protein
MTTWAEYRAREIRRIQGELDLIQSGIDQAIDEAPLLGRWAMRALTWVCRLWASIWVR